MTFQGHESVQQHWLCTNTIICMWFPEGGGQVSGVMVLVQESISYTPSLNQHSTPRSLHLETVMRCCTTATLAPSIRAQHKAEATSRRGRDTNTNSGSVWDSLHSTKLEKGGSFFSGDTNPTSLRPPDGWGVCTSVSYVTQSAAYGASQKAGLSSFALYNVEIQIFLFSQDRLHHVPDSISMLAHGITQ